VAGEEAIRLMSDSVREFVNDFRRLSIRERVELVEMMLFFGLLLVIFVIPGKVINYVLRGR